MDERNYSYNHINGLAVNGTVQPSGIPMETSPKRPGTSLRLSKLRFSVSAILVFAVSTLCFCNSYNGDFVFDDRKAILDNNDLLPKTPLSNLLINDFWGAKMNTRYSHGSYRPLTVLTFRLSYCLGGGYSRPWFHIPNIILHGVISVLLLRIFSILLGGYQADPEGEEAQFNSAKSALLCTMLFAVHPIHTESVSAIVGRADLLCALFFLFSFLLYVKACSNDLDENDNEADVYRPTHFSTPYIISSMLMCFLSVLCKEQGITLIGVCSVYDIVIVCELDPLDLIRIRKSQRSEDSDGQAPPHSKNLSPQPWMISLLKRHVFLVTTGFMIMVFRYAMMGFTPPLFEIDDNPHSFQNGTITRGLNYNYIYSINAWLLVHPWWLCFDWSMGCVPVIKSLFDARVICVVAFWVVVGALLFTCLKNPITKHQRLLIMALALIIVPFLPASNVLFRVGFVVAERVLYLSSLGFCMLVVLGMRQICAVFPKRSQLVHWGFTFLILIFMLRSIQRSSQWRNAMELYKSGEKVCPLNAKVNYNIGHLADENRNLEIAEENYRLAIRLSPTYFGPLNNLGLLLSNRGDDEEAEQLLRRAIEAARHFITVTTVEAHSNLGSLLVRKGDFLDAERFLEEAVENNGRLVDEWFNLGVAKKNLKKYTVAERCFFVVLKYQPRNAKCHNNLGNLYLEMNQFDKAIEAWKRAIILDPTLPSAWISMAVQLDVHGRYAESIGISKRALKYHPDNALLHFNLGNVYRRKQEWLESEKYYLKAIKLDPAKALYYANLGIMYAKWGKYGQAEENYRNALSINPNQPNVKNNLSLLPKIRNM